jgi:hypothetical protein
MKIKKKPRVVTPCKEGSVRSRFEQSKSHCDII